MKKEYVRTIKDGGETLSVYPSVNCFLNDIVAPEHDKMFKSSNKESKSTSNSEFYGTKSWEDAMALRDGWLTGIQKLSFEKKKDL